MLILTRREGDALDITVPELEQTFALTVLKIDSDQVRLRVDCPAHWHIKCNGQASPQGSPGRTGFAAEEFTLAVNGLVSLSIPGLGEMRIPDMGETFFFILTAVHGSQAKVGIRSPRHWNIRRREIDHADRSGRAQEHFVEADLA